MAEKELHLWTCPSCAAPLREDGRRFVCPQGHSFDLAKEGYLHLLTGHRARHGDDAAMMRARRDFLASGQYGFLAEAVASCTARLLEGVSHPVLLDAGCGEGYYTRRVADALTASHVLGVDVSKDAVRMAAKACPAGDFAVGSVYHLPLPERSADAILSIFSPFAREEFLRVLRREGILLSVIPDRHHLWELKERLYATPYENELSPYAVKGFAFLGAECVEQTMVLSQKELSDLFRMTPYYYRTPPEAKARLEGADAFAVRAAFQILMYRVG